MTMEIAQEGTARAVGRVTSTPELVCIILEYLRPQVRNNKGTLSFKSLKHAMLVNKIWFREGSRVLYGCARFTSNQLGDVLRNVGDDTRRQFYATVVKTVCFAEPVKGYQPFHPTNPQELAFDAAVHGVEFVNEYISEAVHTLAIKRGALGKCDITPLCHRLESKCVRLKTLTINVDSRDPGNNAALAQLIRSSAELKELYVFAGDAVESPYPLETRGAGRWPFGGDDLFDAMTHKPLDRLELVGSIDLTFGEFGECQDKIFWNKVHVKGMTRAHQINALCGRLHGTTELDLVLWASDFQSTNVLLQATRLPGLRVFKVSSYGHHIDWSQVAQMGNFSPHLQTIRLHFCEDHGDDGVPTDEVFEEFTSKLPQLENLDLYVITRRLSHESLLSLGLNCRRLQYLKVIPCLADFDLDTMELQLYKHLAESDMGFPLFPQLRRMDIDRNKYILPMVAERFPLQKGFHFPLLTLRPERPLPVYI